MVRVVGRRAWERGGQRVQVLLVARALLEREAHVVADNRKQERQMPGEREMRI